MIDDGWIEIDRQIMNQENKTIKHLTVSGVRKCVTFTCNVCGSVGSTWTGHQKLL